MSRYVVGIDLGTTNCALALCRGQPERVREPGPIANLPIPQVVAVNDVAERPLLPSFLYLPASKEFPPGALDLPWKSPPERLVGTFAREHGAKVPGRLVSSAKSWLSHAGVDRRAAILPWTAAEDVSQDLAGRRRRRPISNTCAMPGTPGSPARRRPTGSRTRRFI